MDPPGPQVDQHLRRLTLFAAQCRSGAFSPRRATAPHSRRAGRTHTRRRCVEMPPLQTQDHFDCWLVFDIRARRASMRRVGAPTPTPSRSDGDGGRQADSVTISATLANCAPKRSRICAERMETAPPDSVSRMGRAQTTGTRAEPRRRSRVAHHRGVPAEPPRHPESPEPADLSAVHRFLSERRRPTAIDLFCGAGGLSLGLERAGFDVIVGADSDAWAVRTHQANLPGLSWCGDLSDPDEFLNTLGAWGIGSVDLLAGGLPCQPFSRAGSSQIRDLVELGRRGSAHDPRADCGPRSSPWSRPPARGRAGRERARPSALG